MIDLLPYLPQYKQALQRNPRLSDIKPSEWAEKNIIIPGKGRLNYDFNPYCREIIDTLAPTHPMRKGAVMKGSQITFSSGVIIPALGYIIAEDPHNSLLMVGTSDLVKPAGEKLDLMIQGARLQDYIRYQVQKKRNTKSGDTDEIKNFSNGYIKIASNSNPKSIAQIDLERIFLDDFDAMQGRSKEAGSFMDLIEMRAAANMNTYKMLMVSTPLNKATSNIEPAYLAGDQRKYMLQCPCCYEPIVLKWKVREGELISRLTEEVAKNDGGIIYEPNNHGQIIKKSVGYVCYRCGGFFTDTNKQQMLRAGYWQPTAVPISDDYYSWWIPSLYAPVGMFDWAYYAGKYLEANPPGQPVKEAKMQTLTNTCMAETYEQAQLSPQAKMLQKNTRSYEVATIPEKMSLEDGNGRIVLLTLAADLNGTMKGVNNAPRDDARLDWEIVAWAANGANYSVCHGSIGTFVPLEGKKDNVAPRKRWTYEYGKPNCVWPELTKILDTTFTVDTGREMGVFIGGVDCGHYSNHAYDYLDRMGGVVVGLRGDKENQALPEGRDVPLFKVGRERQDYFLLDVGRIKDRLSQYMQLRWDEVAGEVQPANFMNYPTPKDGLYGLTNYFEHYEAEHRVLVSNAKGTDTKAIWEKKVSTNQNHFWDVRVYGLALKDLAVYKYAKSEGLKNFTWKDFAEMITRVIEG